MLESPQAQQTAVDATLGVGASVVAFLVGLGPIIQMIIGIIVLVTVIARGWLTYKDVQDRNNKRNRRKSDRISKDS